VSEQQSVEIDLDTLRARMQRGPITEAQIDLLFALVETSRTQAAKAETARLAWTEIGAKAQADAATLCDVIATMGHIARHPDGLAFQAIDALSRGILEREHPGAALLTELQAAHAVVMAARKCRAALPSAPDMHDRLVALSSAIYAYDRVTKARPA